MEYTITFVTLIAGVITIIWFIRDVRKENSKVLKSVLDVQKIQSEILVKIEEGQRKGFESMEKGQRKGFESMEKGQREGFQVLQKSFETIQKSVELIARLVAKAERT